MKKTFKQLMKRFSCNHEHIDFRGGYIENGVRFECRDCSRTVVVPLQNYLAINPVRQQETIRIFFKALLAMRRGL